MKAGFKNQRFQVETADGHNINLLRAEPFTDTDGTQYLIPEGQDSDGGSEPPVLWGPPFNMPPFGLEWPAYLLHDSAYRNRLLKLVNGQWTKANLPKKQCDDLLYNALVSLGVSVIRRSAILRGLQDFGGSSFREDRK